MAGQREHYEREFEDLVFASRPGSVLDIGCGEGAFIRRALARGVQAAGVEPDAARTAACREAGLDVREAKADALAFADQSYDCVVCERSAHHFGDLAAGLAEAARVARNAIFIFDPWFDETIPSQAAAAAIERWEKRVDTARGHVNNGPLSAGDFLRALPRDLRAHDIEIVHRLNLVSVSLDDIAASASAQLEGWKDAGPFRAELDAHLASARHRRQRSRRDFRDGETCRLARARRAHDPRLGAPLAIVYPALRGRNEAAVPNVTCRRLRCATYTAGRVRGLVRGRR